MANRTYELGSYGPILLAALAGLFGHGPTSEIELALDDPPDSHTVTDEFSSGRALERMNRDSLCARPNHSYCRVSAWPGWGDSLSQVDIGRITPQPVYEELAAGGVRYHFRLQDGSQTIIFSTQSAMIGNDYSMTNGMLVVLTLVGLDILLSHVKRWSTVAEAWLDGKPTLIVEHGHPKTEIMNRAYIPLTILPVSASTRRRRDLFSVSMISTS